MAYEARNGTVRVTFDVDLDEFNKLDPGGPELDGHAFMRWFSTELNEYGNGSFYIGRAGGQQVAVKHYTIGVFGG
jgi:hypothetical protein